jgi:hypothetical protein
MVDPEACLPASPVFDRDSTRRFARRTNSRIRLLPWVFDGKADARPGMKDAWSREPVIGQPDHSLPDQAMSLAPPPKRLGPEPDDAVTKGAERSIVGRHGVIGIVAHEHLLQPSSLLGDGPMHAPSQLVLDLLQLRYPAVPPALPEDLEPALPGLSADVSEAKEVERLRFAKPLPLSRLNRIAAKLDQSGLVRVELQRKLLQPVSHHAQEALAVSLMLKAHHNIISIADDDHVASGLTPSPAFGPEIEHIVQVDVGQER